MLLSPLSLGLPYHPCPLAQIDVSATVNTRAGSSAPAVRAGEPVVVDYRLTNSGALPLVDVQIAEPGALGGAVVCPGGGHAVSLQPGASVDCTVRISALAGAHAGTATVSAHIGLDDHSDYDDYHEWESNDDWWRVSASAAVGYQGIASSLGVAEHVSMSPDATGAQVTLTYVLTNTGQASLFDVAVADAVLPAGAPCPKAGSGLPPGATTTCTATTHLIPGTYHSSATATADDRTTTVGADGQSVPPPKLSATASADFKVVALPPSPPPPTSPTPTSSPSPSPSPPSASPPTPTPSSTPPTSVPPPPPTSPPPPQSPTPPSTTPQPPSSPPPPSSAPPTTPSYRPPARPAAQLAARPGMKTPLFLLVMMLPAAGAAAVIAARRK